MMLQNNSLKITMVHPQHTGFRKPAWYYGQLPFRPQPDFVNTTQQPGKNQPKIYTDEQIRNRSDWFQHSDQWYENHCHFCPYIYH
jgi:hypothetical protein